MGTDYLWYLALILPACRQAGTFPRDSGIPLDFFILVRDNLRQSVQKCLFL